MPAHQACAMYRRNVIKVSSIRPELIIDRKSPLLIRNMFKKLERGELQLCEQSDVSFVAGFVDGLRKGNKGYMLFEGEPNHMFKVSCLYMLVSILLLDILKMQYLVFVLRTFLISILDYLSRR